MWIYTQPKEHNKAESTRKSTSGANRTMPVSFSEDDNGQSAASKSVPLHGETIVSNAKFKGFMSGSKPVKGQYLLFLLYVIGLCAGGIIHAFAKGDTAALLQYYVENRISIFNNAQNALHIFSVLFLSGILSMILIMLSGFCAFGAPAVFVLMMAKGVGTGLLSKALFADYGWQGILLYICGPAFSDAFLCVCMCFLGASSISGARTLFDGYVRDLPVKKIEAKKLINQFLLLCTLQILSCGANAIASCCLIPLLQRI